ncbi:S1/P1 nuclease [Trichodelitschia bisporula]|uniref:S1/P1 nuclease n=1 Tax=Trichodelitschia bisporula TaxID=703511 RepID=A0A6G1I978_9PEZI|nr:S1/P1 nuclease [Trichodelitschia bisporula]
MRPTLLLAALGPLPTALAWGALGHSTVALIAQALIKPETQTWAQGVLANKNSTYLADVANWADSYRSTSAGAFSSPYHYIDAEDSPPHNCSVDFERDCGPGGCVVAAIANYTTRVQDSTLPSIERDHALRFVVHFVGDIHQPLHCEALEKGGNGIKVTFNGSSTNLHHVWDSNIAEKLIGGFNTTYAAKWMAQLVPALQTGVYAAQTKGWTKGLSVGKAKEAALLWAGEANGEVCTAVMPQGVDAVETGDLAGKYYTGTAPVVQEQIAKAGYRLAAWLDLIATGCTAL